MKQHLTFFKYSLLNEMQLATIQYLDKEIIDLNQSITCTTKCMIATLYITLLLPKLAENLLIFVPFLHAYQR